MVKHVGDAEVLKDASTRLVVRHGNTVHRTRSPYFQGVHALLLHLEARGFAGSPRFLGYDDEGHEVLTYLEGQSSRKPYLPAFLTDDGCAAIGRFIKAAHDATGGFEPPPDAVWIRPNPYPEKPFVMCHGDLHPGNIIWQAGQPTGLIDWDLASPAPKIFDLAFLAWRLAPLRDSVWAANAGYLEEPDRSARLEALLDGYGEYSPCDVLDALVDFLRLEQELIRTQGPKGIQPWEAHLRHRLQDVLERERRWIDTEGRKVI